MFDPTPAQAKAITTTGRSVLVSAAAGSGKTAVLARRCAYLVCDAAPDVRCNVDELLVLTFTDAAAAEMRARIIDAIRTRSAESPDDDRLRRQVLLVGAARISTIHSFCNWLLRRWFCEAGIDPAATLMDADEARLLRAEVLDEFFETLYATGDSPDHPLGDDLDEQAGGAPDDTDADAALGARFRRLVDDYGLGKDAGIRDVVQRVAEFLTSLPDPEAWLKGAAAMAAGDAGASGGAEAIVIDMMRALHAELANQQEFAAGAATIIEAGDAAAHGFAEMIRDHADALRQWSELLPKEHDAKPLMRYGDVCAQIGEHKLSGRGTPRLGKAADATVVEAFDRAKPLWGKVKKHFDERLRKPFGRFTIAEWIAGLDRTAPYAGTIAQLVRGFRLRYASRKRRMDLLDFADLERMAYELLAKDGDPQRASPIATKLHARFAHVLVDEFQDINPIQEAIIRLASHEAAPDRPNNLFVVGDVKQSIYRFRLAEPGIFTARHRAFRAAKNTGDDAALSAPMGDDGVAIALRSNFRSRPEVIDAVNLLFGKLMQGPGSEVTYDADAELCAERNREDPGEHTPVELHVLERTWPGPGDDEDTPPEPVVTDVSDPSRWTPVEREALLISRCIERMREEAAQANRPLRFRDFVILVRNARVSAERISNVLVSTGVPAYADVGGSLLDAKEVRDVLAVLQVLDNAQQDIPLAAVLRNGMLAQPMSEDELVEIRCIDRRAPFHSAVRSYADTGQDRALRERVRTVLRRIEVYRDLARRRPLADVLWRYYEQSGHLAQVGGLPNGPQRRANLLALHEKARRFGSFRRQGLYRFLRFLESLQDRELGVAAAPAVGEADDVVRIMTIHASKGLEFPVVFVAGLGTAFNLGDRSGRIIFERRVHLGLKVVDPDSMIEYPSASHWRVKWEIERAARQEELRVLYVAMTRARDRLILIGSARGADRFLDGRQAAGARDRPTALAVATASSPLDWIGEVLRQAAPGVVRSAQNPGAEEPTLVAHLHPPAEIAGWSVPRPRDLAQDALCRAVAACQPLPPDEPLAPNDTEVERVRDRIDCVYPSLAAASMPAVVAAGALKGAFDPDSMGRVEPDDAAASLHPVGMVRDQPFEIPPSKYGPLEADSAARRGTLTHRVLEHLDFVAATGDDGVASELQRMVDAGVISEPDRAVIDQASLQWFVATPLAGAIRRAGGGYRRELKLLASEPPCYLDPTTGPLPDDFVLVRGIVDGLFVENGEAHVVDFKTDRIDIGEVAARTALYRPQIELYARAVSRLLKLPVACGWLVFLSPRETTALTDLHI